MAGTEKAAAVVDVRGEIKATIAGRELRLVAENKALRRIEVDLQVGIPRLLARFSENDRRLGDIATVLQHTGGLKESEAFALACRDFGAASMAAIDVLVAAFHDEDPAAGKAATTAS